jgi:hypothetical protein
VPYPCWGAPPAPAAPRPRLRGFLDVQRAKAYTRWAEQHEKEAGGNALQVG